MDFIEQVADLKIVTVTEPRTFMKWNNTEEGRDKNDCYERVDIGIIFWVDQNNRSIKITESHKFFHVLEEMYQKAIDSKNEVVEIEKKVRDCDGNCEGCTGCDDHKVEEIVNKDLKIGDTVNFYIDMDNYTGVIKRVNEKTVDALAFIGMITNIPIDKIETR